MWGGVRPALAAKTTTPSPPACACSVGGRLLLYGEKRVRAALATGLESCGYCVSKPQPSICRGVGEEDPRRWPQRQQRQVRQRARAPWAVGRFSTSARAPLAMGLESCGHCISQPPTWRGVVEEEPRPTAWGSVLVRTPRAWRWTRAPDELKQKAGPFRAAASPPHNIGA